MTFVDDIGMGQVVIKRVHTFGLGSVFGDPSSGSFTDTPVTAMVQPMSDKMIADSDGRYNVGDQLGFFKSGDNLSVDLLGPSGGSEFFIQHPSGGDWYKVMDVKDWYIGSSWHHTEAKMAKTRTVFVE